MVLYRTIQHHTLQDSTIQCRNARHRTAEYAVFVTYSCNLYARNFGYVRVLYYTPPAAVHASWQAKNYTVGYEREADEVQYRQRRTTCTRCLQCDVKRT